jgi:AcrR family transcriptional regulator
MPRIALSPRKAPRQQRSEAMVELLLQAAARVLARESLAGFTTNRVAEVAGVSVGSLYQYFPNKEALTAALIERAQAGLLAAVEAVVAETEGAPLEEALRRLAQLAIRQQFEQPLLAAALDHEERRLPLARRLREHEARLVAVVEAWLARHAAEIDPQRPAATARDLVAICKAVVEADVPQTRQPAPDLEGRVVRALRGYLEPPR